MAPSWAAVPYPAHLPASGVTALVLNYITAWQMLTRAAPVADGSTILVHAAAGGIGTALLQLAAIRGLRVFGTVSAAKADLVRNLGAIPIDYHSQDVPATVRQQAPDGIEPFTTAWAAATGGRACRCCGPAVTSSSTGRPAP